MHAAVVGIHHVKLPVTNLPRSQEWYVRVFGFVPELEFLDDDGVARGVVGRIPGLGDCGFALRENAESAIGFRSFDPVCFGIADEAAATAWADQLDRLGVTHTPVLRTPAGWMLALQDPDGIELRLYSWARPDADPAAPLPGHPVVRAVSSVAQ